MLVVLCADFLEGGQSYPNLLLIGGKTAMPLILITYEQFEKTVQGSWMRDGRPWLALHFCYFRFPRHPNSYYFRLAD